MSESRFEGDFRRKEKRIFAKRLRLQDAVFDMRVFDGIVWRPALKTVMEIPSDAGGHLLGVKGEHEEKREEECGSCFHGSSLGF